MVNTPEKHGPSLVNTLRGQDSPVMNTPASRDSRLHGVFGTGDSFCARVLVDSPVVNTPGSRLRYNELREYSTNFKTVYRYVYVYLEEDKLFDEKTGAKNLESLSL